MRKRIVLSALITFSFSIAVSLIFATIAPAENMPIVKEDSKEKKPDENRKMRWIGAYGSFGAHHHIWSASDYKGYKQNTFGAFMEWETGYWIPLPIKAQRTFRLELRYSDIWGTIELSSDQVPAEKRNGGPYYTTLDHYQIALLCVRRWVFLPDYFIRPTLHLGFGVSMLNKAILEDGTLHNFNFVGGGGFEFDIYKKWSGFADLRWEHYSNGGQMYLTNSAVIGPESINGVFGVRYQF